MECRNNLSRSNIPSYHWDLYVHIVAKTVHLGVAPANWQRTFRHASARASFYVDDKVRMINWAAIFMQRCVIEFVGCHTLFTRSASAN